MSDVRIDEHGIGVGSLAAEMVAREPRARRDHARLMQRDAALWPAPPETTAPWLGWLDSLERAPAHVRHIRSVVHDLSGDDFRHVVLVGMGGSSLFPLVLAGLWPSGAATPRLHVLDSTDPAAVASVEEDVDWASTLVVAASKSGTTIETLAHLDRFAARLLDACGEEARRRIVVVTDPGGPLEQRAADAGFRAVISGDSDVGGRYSALSPFGLLPAELLAIDTDTLLGAARAAEAGWNADPWADTGPAYLATFLAAGVAAGRDALVLLVDPRLGDFGAWIEQLVAESSGKDGTGLLPVVLRSAREVAALDRAIAVTIGDVAGLSASRVKNMPTVHIPWQGNERLGVEVLRWMQAVALACAQLGVNPFDQPDVAAAKAATADALTAGTEPEPAVAWSGIEHALAGAAYLAVLAYVHPERGRTDRLSEAAQRLSRSYGIPVTVGIGPRYLHSTGQLHKGGREDGVFLMVVGEDERDVEIPGRPYGFSRLKRAQAAGDLAALRASGRRAFVVHEHELVEDDHEDGRT